VLLISSDLLFLRHKKAGERTAQLFRWEWLVLSNPMVETVLKSLNLEATEA